MVRTSSEVKVPSNVPMEFDTNNGWRGRIAVSTERKVGAGAMRQLAKGGRHCRRHTRTRFLHTTHPLALDVSVVSEGVEQWGQPGGGSVVLEVEVLDSEGVTTDLLKSMISNVCSA